MQNKKIVQKLVSGSVTEAVFTDIKLSVPRALPITMLCVCVMICIFHLFTGFFGGLSPYPQRLVTLSMFMVLGFFFYPLNRTSWRDKFNWGIAVDAFFILLIIAGTDYVIMDWYDFSSYRMSDSLPVDRAVSTIFILLLLELLKI